MAWRDPLLLNRFPVLVNNDGARNASYDLEITIDTTWDLFWAAMAGDTNGYGLRVSGGNGVNSVQYDLVSYSLANRTCVLGIDNYTLVTDLAENLWVYYGMATPTDASSVLTIASAEQALGMIRADPTASPYLIDATRALPYGATVLDQQIHAPKDAQILVPFKLPMARGTGMHNGHVQLEELTHVELASSGVYDNAAELVGPSAAYAQEWNDDTYVWLSLDLSSIAVGTYHIRLRWRSAIYGQTADISAETEARALFTIYDVQES